MAAESGVYVVNPPPNRRESKPDTPILFKGSGNATLTVFGMENWKEFLCRGDRPLTDVEVERIDEAATLENFSIGGRIAVEWPEVEIAFAMDDFVGKHTINARQPRPSFNNCTLAYVRMHAKQSVYM